MFFKLALALFLMVNGSPVGPLGVAVVDAKFPTEQACTEYAASDAGLNARTKVEAFGKSRFSDAVVVVPECVGVSPSDVPKEPAPHPDNREPAVLPSRPKEWEI